MLAESGEDSIAFSDKSDYAANVELAEAIAPIAEATTENQVLTLIDTPKSQTITEVAEQLQIEPKQIIKTLLVHADQNSPKSLVALVVRGDHQLNELKAEKLPLVANPLTLASDDEIQAEVNCAAGSIGPVKLDLPIIVDHSAAAMSHFVCGANQIGQHLPWGQLEP